MLPRWQTQCEPTSTCRPQTMDAFIGVLPPVLRCSPGHRLVILGRMERGTKRLCADGLGRAPHFLPDLWLRGWLPRSGARLEVRGAERRGSSRRISVRLALPLESRAAGFSRGSDGRFFATDPAAERTAMTGVSGGGGRTTRLGFLAAAGFLFFTDQPSAVALKSATTPIADRWTQLGFLPVEIRLVTSAATNA